MNQLKKVRPKEEHDAGSISLDRDVSLSEELNLSSDPPSLFELAESGALRPERTGRSDIREPEELLVQAIVRQAVDDWRQACRILRLRPGHPEALAMRRETENFFRSRWFQTLVDLDGEVFLARLRKAHGVSGDSLSEKAPQLRIRRLRKTQLQRQNRNRQAAVKRTLREK